MSEFRDRLILAVWEYLAEGPGNKCSASDREQLSVSIDGSVDVRGLVDVLLEKMWEPTEAMLDAALAADYHYEACSHEEGWKAMLDEACGRPPSRNEDL